MSFVGLSPEEERTMLARIGVERFEDLLEAVPGELRLRQPLPVAGPLSEIELRRQFGAWSRQNHADRAVSFMGGGMYDHYVPAAVNALAMRSEFATAYTPYQAEVAQGSLTAIFEFQSMIAELAGMEVANASLYDGATATVEAALLARHHTGRPRVLASASLHPRTLEVLRTYLGAERVTEIAAPDGVTDLETLERALTPEVAGVIYAQPGFFGLIEHADPIHRAAHAVGALAIAACDPIALVVLEPPGAANADGSPGADIVVGEGQSLGNYPSLGGPSLGFFACRQALVRRMPGRLAAETVDRHGRRGFVLTLQTREQHIRREKATSNICTNQGLLALRATIHMGLLGREGMREVAELCIQKTHHAARLAAAIPGYALAYPGAFVREFVLDCPLDAARVIAVAREDGILPGVDLGQFRPEWKRRLLVAVTEQRSAAEIERWAAALRRAGGQA